MTKQEIQLKRIQKYIENEERIESLKIKFGITGNKSQQKELIKEKLLELNNQNESI